MLSTFYLLLLFFQYFLVRIYPRAPLQIGDCLSTSPLDLATFLLMSFSHLSLLLLLYLILLLVMILLMTLLKEHLMLTISFSVVVFSVAYPCLLMMKMNWILLFFFSFLCLVYFCFVFFFCHFVAKNKRFMHCFIVFDS